MLVQIGASDPLPCPPLVPMIIPGYYFCNSAEEELISPSGLFLDSGDEGSALKLVMLSQGVSSSVSEQALPFASALEYEGQT